MKTYLVQLEDHDDFVSARDKISWSKARRVLLVWPRKGKILYRRVDLLLLQRHSQQLGVQLALVTRSAEVKAHAHDLGIPLFENTIKAQAANWRRGPRKRAPLLSAPEARAPGERPVMERWRLREQHEAFHRPGRDWRLPRVLAFLVGVLAFLALVFFFVPGARVELTPLRQTQRLSIPVWASPEIRAANPSGGLPAQRLTVVVEGRDQAPSSGQTRVPERAAEGQVRLTNLTDQEVEAPAGSVVLTLSDPPVRFFLARAVRVPAGPGRSMHASVRAALPGGAGNVAAGEIRAMEGPTGLRLAVENPEPLSGGSDRLSPAPTANDYRLLQAKLQEALRETALDELASQVRPGQYLLPATLSQLAVIEESQEPASGQPADRLQLSLRVEYAAWMVEEADLRAVSQAALDATLESGLQAVPDTLRFVFVEPPAAEGAALSDNRYHWTLNIERAVQARWAPAQMAQAIQGRAPEEASLILQEALALTGPPRFDIFPAWWARLPFLPFRIELVEDAL